MSLVDEVEKAMQDMATGKLPGACREAVSWPAILAAVKATESKIAMDALMLEIMSSAERQISDAEALRLATKMNTVSKAHESACDAYRQATKEPSDAE